MKKMTTPIRYYGGKQKMLKHILPIIPKHNLYCEPFVGGGAVFWAKPKSKVEVINDFDNRIVTFYKICQTEFGALRTLILATTHSRNMYREAAIVLKHPEVYSELKRAWAFWVQTNMSFAGLLLGGFGYDKRKGSMSLSLYNKKSRLIKQFQQRLDLVQIECNDAIKVIKSRDTEDSFFYCDPPYYNSDCGHYKGYTLENYTGLLETLSGIKGKFLLSCYPSEVMLEFASKYGWTVREFNSKVAITHLTAKTKTEVLVANYPI